MIYIQGTVKGSSVKLPDAIKVSDGSRVIVTILEPTTKIKDKFLSQELENEDLEFVRACRGRLAKQLQSADDWWQTTLNREKFGGRYFGKKNGKSEYWATGRSFARHRMDYWSFRYGSLELILSKITFISNN